MKNSIRNRFVFTVSANLFRSFLSFTTGLLLARFLGAESYGNMAFLLGTFSGVLKLLDMGSSAAFFTFISQQSQSRYFIRFFFVWLAVQFIISLCIIGFLIPSNWIDIIWRGERHSLVLLAFIAVFMQGNVWPILQQAGESQRKTFWVQTVTVAIVLVHLLSVLLLWQFGMLGLYAIFIAIAVEYLLAAIVVHSRFLYSADNSIDQTPDKPLHILKKYFQYCKFMIPYSWIGFAYIFADRWMLQSYGGAVEQAYYAVAVQFSIIALIATTSILRIFWKEISEAHHQGDHRRAGELYLKVSRLLFLVSAVFAGFLMPWSETILREILGASYADGTTALRIMFLYPIHQSMGQIGGTMLFATERVSLQSIIGISFMVLSIVATYVVLAPIDAIVPGFGLASAGLALKMVVMQLIQVNVVAYIIARIWKWKFDWIYQPVVISGCISLGWIAYFAVNYFLGPEFPFPIVMGLCGVVFLSLMAAFVCIMPWLVGLTRDELILNVKKAYNRILKFCYF